MKLNYRDKIIAAIVLAFAVLLLGFFALVKPKYSDIKDNKVKLAQKQTERQDIENKIAEIPGLKKDITNTYTETSKKTEIFVAVDNIGDPIAVDEYLQKLADDNKVRIDSLQVKSPVISDIPFYFYKKDDNLAEARKSADINGRLQEQFNETYAESIALSGSTSEKILSTEYGVQIYGTKKNIGNYLKAIKEFDKALTVKSVSIGDPSFGKNTLKDANINDWDGLNSEDEQTIQVGDKTIKNTQTAQIVITLYSVYEMDEPNVD
ncbi:hypothetical protein [Ruminococcus sp.]|uniref:hypothetical protein n=1 Tax=Ruminococcus sp. TaxID=41978 RepID=UPI001B4A7143|nr:hypothetical protein [Ruminococcus sp.]MBP5431757.1 hypothetical protein [Ruminococcus sp.]